MRASRPAGAGPGAASAATAALRSTSCFRRPGCRSRSAISIPVAAAPLADAGLTPYHAVKRALRDLRPGSTAVVIGVGGLGHVAVQLLRALSGCRIVAVDRRQEALDVALEAGADVALQADGLTPEDVRHAAGGRGAALVIDCVGIDATLELTAACVATGRACRRPRRGRRDAAVPLRGDPVRDAGRVLELGDARRARGGGRASRAQAPCEIEVERVRLDEVPAAYERLEAGDVQRPRGRGSRHRRSRR